MNLIKFLLSGTVLETSEPEDYTEIIVSTFKPLQKCICRKKPKCTQEFNKNKIILSIF